MRNKLKNKIIWEYKQRLLPQLWGSRRFVREHDQVYCSNSVPSQVPCCCCWFLDDRTICSEWWISDWNELPTRVRVSDSASISRRSFHSFCDVFANGSDGIRRLMSITATKSQKPPQQNKRLLLADRPCIVNIFYSESLARISADGPRSYQSRR